jgi:flavodoxin
MYYSKTGNTKKVADAIAKTFDQTAEAAPPAYPLDNVKLLFLGAGVYGSKIDKTVVEFIRTLTVKNVKNIALFSTAGNPASDVGIKAMKQLLEGKGINVLDESFNCAGKFFGFFQRKHPSSEDLRLAQDFAGRVVKMVQE